MAGVYIPGMEMPKSCTECLNIGWQYVFECNLDDVESGARLGSCPLIPVPDHGRLIDLDAFLDGCKKLSEDNDPEETEVHLEFLRYFFDKILPTPTIIPADKNGGKDNV